MRIINAGDRVMNTWIYEIPDGYVMIDTGYPGKLKSVEKRMKRHGIRWSDILPTGSHSQRKSLSGSDRLLTGSGFMLWNNLFRKGSEAEVCGSGLHWVQRFLPR